MVGGDASFFFFNDTATTEIYTLSLHDALPISVAGGALAQTASLPVLKASPKEPADKQLAVGDDRPTLAAVKAEEDRKSTRLNSSHANISYAVFCLKKKMPCAPPVGSSNEPPPA